jgi:pimeloyl-ACP methyl ester carboxylesterase
MFARSRAWRLMSIAALTLWSSSMCSTAVAAPSCQIDTPPPKTAVQLAKETLIWGKWTAFEERNIRIDSAAQPTPTYHVLMKRPGPAPDTSKPLVVFLHGYPEFAWSWEDWLKLTGSQHDAIAIDLKGYGDSSKPTDLASYDFKRVVDEIDDIATCLGYSKVIPVGHDWGGTFAWLYSLYHAERTQALVVLSTPHPYTFYRELAKPDSEQRKRSHYMELIRQNTPTSMVTYYAGLAKETSLFGPFYKWPRVDRLLLSNMDSLWKWNRMFSYYRVMDFPPSPLEYPDVPSAESLATFTVQAPTLAFFGTADPYFAAESWRGVEQFVPRLDFRQIEGAGHFIDHDVPGLPQQALDFINAHSH